MMAKSKGEEKRQNNESSKNRKLVETVRIRAASAGKAVEGEGREGGSDQLKQLQRALAELARTLQGMAINSEV